MAGDGAEGRAAEELAEARGLDDGGQCGQGADGGDDDRSAPAAAQQGLAELRAHERDEGDGAGPEWRGR
ncbi:hypothetical protein AB0D71_43320 [Streptomyces avermitilis]|uniref:hypothetical protein n=1 Tax=Streptomyces avermitilis TaxID=33903 RepID=UPI0033FC3CAA